jgi:rhamnosyltransferase
MSISVVIPTQNAAGYLPGLVAALRNQSMPPAEIIIIDSSHDGKTIEAASALGCSTTSIRPSDFSHGGSRNLGARLASGEAIVFLTQDVEPANQFFLEQLVAPLGAKKSTGVFARQVAHSWASHRETFLRNYHYPAVSRCRDSAAAQSEGVRAFHFSNAASAVLKDEFLELGGFETNIIQNEDMAFCAKALGAGKRISYVAEAVVFHTHNYGLMRHFRRFFDLGAFYSVYSDRLGCKLTTGNDGIEFLKGLMNFLWAKGRRTEIPIALAECLSKWLGHRIGSYAGKHPSKFWRRFSNNPAYWLTSTTPPEHTIVSNHAPHRVASNGDGGKKREGNDGGVRTGASDRQFTFYDNNSPDMR